MICPICGTQQRSSAQCVQCHTPVSGNKKSTEEENDLLGIEPSLDESLKPAAKSAVSDVPKKPVPSHASYPASQPANETSLISKPALDPPLVSKKARAVLISTTQRVEGKRIRQYFGLIHATVIVSLSDEWASSERGTHQILFKDGTKKALNTLKKEAADLGGNAVVATTLDTHRIDSESILLSAIGTAVSLEGPK